MEKNGKKFNKEINMKGLKKPFDFVINAIYSLPNERMQEVIIKRFGLENENPQTLESIGKKFSITRERVRQIESEALARIKREQRKNRIAEVRQKLKELIEKRKGIMSEERIQNEYLNRRLDKTDIRSLLLVLKMGDEFYFLNRPQDYEKTWYLKGADIGLIYELTEWLQRSLEQRKKVASKKTVLTILNKNEKFIPIDDEILYTYLDIPKIIQKDIFNRWGLANWPLIHPRGVRDKIYLAFKKRGEPMHFNEVSKEVNDLGIDRKQVCTPTVHNELIKDKRFVLIGRGIYALSEWNYNPGTVAQVLKSILEKQGKPMLKNELVKEVLKQRKVKPGTVILNLQNSQLFLKKDQDLYFLK
ncbi:MAG: sigma factor-like helix-turn-helix DNA-binding protein [Patescibacteria group bacterium]|nr:hypothetical protein [Patescibacteria group bacterium]